MSKIYTSHDRVKTALEHKEPDRVPFDLGGSAVTGINIKSVINLRNYLGLPQKEVALYNSVIQLGMVDDDLVDRLNIDVRTVDPTAPYKKSVLEKEIHIVDKNYRLTDEFGIGWRMPIDGGHFFDIYKSPLENAETIEDINKFNWPDMSDAGRYVTLKERADNIVFGQKKAYMLGRMFSGMWETAMWMTGYEKFFCDMILDEALIHSIMGRMTELKMMYWEKALEQVGENVLVVSEADDLGSQNGLLCSIEQYKRLIWPYHKKLFEFIKKKAKSKVYIFFHCDGSCNEAIPLLIDAGVDILNPVQVNCEGMDTKSLKREFGRDITFWGALCDSQLVLPFGTPEQVREETKRRVDDCMPGGGWIAAPIHNILSEVPPENIMAMWETLQKYGVY